MKLLFLVLLLLSQIVEGVTRWSYDSNTYLLNEQSTDYSNSALWCKRLNMTNIYFDKSSDYDALVNVTEGAVWTDIHKIFSKITHSKEWLSHGSLIDWYTYDIGGDCSILESGRLARAFCEGSHATVCKASFCRIDQKSEVRIPHLDARVCSGRGHCISNDHCYCDGHYYGDVCQYDRRTLHCNGIAKESPLVCQGRGSCISNDQCQCPANYTGSDCQYAICFGLAANDEMACMSPGGRGYCTAPDQCDCATHRTGYDGERCERPVCHVQGRMNGCGPHGRCTAPDHCECSDGYQGSDCSHFQCYGKSGSFPYGEVCGGNGVCVGPDQCRCNPGWSGLNCSEPYCPTRDGVSCSGNGVCVSPSNCSCSSGYYGPDCSAYRCSGYESTSAEVCSGGRGVCVAPDHCQCSSTEYDGADCSHFQCHGKNASSSDVCGGHGVCIAPDECVCEKGMSGPDCREWSCFNKTMDDESVCSGRGTCVALDQCLCSEKWHYSGDECQTPRCFNVSGAGACSGSGTCRGPDECECYAGFSSFDCSKVVLKKSRGLLGGGGWCADSDGCNQHGTCTDSACVCSQGYTGTHCDTNICYGLEETNPDVCGGYKRGSCGIGGECNCLVGSSDQYCTGFVCTPPPGSSDACSGRGDCIYSETCRCDAPYAGADCSSVAKCRMKHDVCSSLPTIVQDEFSYLDTTFYNALVSGQRFQSCRILEPFMLVKNRDLFDALGRCNFDFDPAPLLITIHDNQKQMGYTLLFNKTLIPLCPNQESELEMGRLVPYDFSMTSDTNSELGVKTGRVVCAVNPLFTDEEIKTNQFRFRTIRQAVLNCALSVYEDVVVGVATKRQDVIIRLNSQETTRDLYLETSVILKKRRFPCSTTIEPDIEIVVEDGVYNENIIAGSNYLSTADGDTTCNSAHYRSVYIRGRNALQSVVNGFIEVYAPMNTLRLEGLFINVPDNTVWFQNGATLHNFIAVYCSVMCGLYGTQLPSALYKVPDRGLLPPAAFAYSSMNGFHFDQVGFERCNGLKIELFEANTPCGNPSLPFSVQYTSNGHGLHNSLVLAIYTLDRSSGITPSSRRLDLINIVGNSHSQLSDTGLFRSTPVTPIDSLYGIDMSHYSKWVAPANYDQGCFTYDNADYKCMRRVGSIRKIVFSSNNFYRVDRTVFAAIHALVLEVIVSTNFIDVRKPIIQLYNEPYYKQSLIGLWLDPTPTTNADLFHSVRLAITNNRFNMAPWSSSAPSVMDLIRVGNFHVTGYEFPVYYDVTSNAMYTGYINTDGTWYNPPYASGYAYSIRKFELVGNECTAEGDPGSCAYRAGVHIVTSHGEHMRFVYYETYSTTVMVNTDTFLRTIPYTYMLKNGASMTGVGYDMYIEMTAEIPTQFETAYGAVTRCNITCRGDCNKCLVDPENIPAGGIYIVGTTGTTFKQHCFDITAFNILARGSALCKHQTIQLYPTIYDSMSISFSATSTVVVEPYPTTPVTQNKPTIVYSDTAALYEPEIEIHPIRIGSNIITFNGIDFLLKKANGLENKRLNLFYAGPVYGSAVTSLTFSNCRVYGDSSYSMSIFDEYSTFNLLRELSVIESEFYDWSWSGVTGGAYRFKSIRSKYYRMKSGAINTKATETVIIQDNEMIDVAPDYSVESVLYIESCACTAGCSIKGNQIIADLQYIQLEKDKKKYDDFSSPALIYINSAQFVQDNIHDNSYYGSQIGLKYSSMRYVPCSKSQLRAMHLNNPIISGTKADLACRDSSELHCSGFCMNRTDSPTVCIIDKYADVTSVDYGFNIFSDFQQAIYSCNTLGTMKLLVRPGTYDEYDEVLAFTSSSTTTQTKIEIKVDGPCRSVTIVASSVTFDSAVFYGGIYLECLNFYYYRDTASLSTTDKTFVRVIGSRETTVEMYNCLFASQLTRVYNQTITYLKQNTGNYQLPGTMLDIAVYGGSSQASSVIIEGCQFDSAWDYGLYVEANSVRLYSIELMNIGECAVSVQYASKLLVQGVQCTQYCGMWSSKSGRLSLVDITLDVVESGSLQIMQNTLQLTDIFVQDKVPSSTVRYSGIKLAFTSKMSTVVQGFTFYMREMSVVDYPVALRIDTTITSQYILLNEPSGLTPLYDDDKRYMRELMVLNSGVNGFVGSYWDVRHASYALESTLNDDYVCNDLCPNEEDATCSVRSSYGPSTIGYGRIFFSSIERAIYDCVRTPRIIRLVYLDQSEMNNEQVSLVHSEVVHVDTASLGGVIITIKGQSNIFYPTRNITWSGGIRFKRSNAPVFPYANIRIVDHLELHSGQSCDSFVAEEDPVYGDSSFITLENIMLSRGDCTGSVGKPFISLSNLFVQIRLENLYVVLSETSVSTESRLISIDGGCQSYVHMNRIEIRSPYKNTNMIALKRCRSISIVGNIVEGCSFGTEGGSYPDGSLFTCLYSSVCSSGSFVVSDNVLKLSSVGTIERGALSPYNTLSGNAYSCMTLHFIGTLIQTPGQELNAELSSGLIRNQCSGAPPLGIKLIDYVVPSLLDQYPGRDAKYYARNLSANNPSVDAYRFDIILNQGSEVKDLVIHTNEFVYASYHCLDQCGTGSTLPVWTIVGGVAGGLAGLIIVLALLSILSGRSVFGILFCDPYNSRGAKEKYEEERPQRTNMVVPITMRKRK